MNNLTISFIGDISLNDNYIKYYNKGIDPFSGLRNHLQRPDYVVGNLESMAKSNEGENAMKRPRLVTTIDTLNYLKGIHLSIACLANNHVYDHLKEGFLNTIDFLKRNNIDFLGAGLNEWECKRTNILAKNGIKVGLLNYVTEDTNPNLPNEAPVYLNIFDIDEAIMDINSIRSNVDHIIILMHWGGKVEGGLFPDISQRNLARTLIDKGADLIIGNHSHTFQPFEQYKGKYVFYSLGNFCFSDYFFEGVFYPMSERRKLTSIIDISFTSESYQVQTRFWRNNGMFFEPYGRYNKISKRRNFIYKYLLRFKIPFYLYQWYSNYLFRFISFMRRTDINFRIKVLRVWKSLKKNVRYSR